MMPLSAGEVCERVGGHGPVPVLHQGHPYQLQGHRYGQLDRLNESDLAILSRMYVFTFTRTFQSLIGHALAILSDPCPFHVMKQGG